jgi:hypothetical protein
MESRASLPPTIHMVAEKAAEDVMVDAGAEEDLHGERIKADNEIFKKSGDDKHAKR